MKFLPFDQDRHNEDVVRRLRDLERAAGKNQRPGYEELAIFSAYDTPVVPSSYTLLPPWPVRRGGQVVAVLMTAGVAASGSSTFQLRQNGTVIGSTLTFPASTNIAALYAGDVRVPGGVGLVLEPLTIGAGLKGFGAIVVMKG
jgi:hypothetical protein